MIEFRNVHAAYDDQLPVLRDVSFTIDDGEFVAFVGTNGAGKSTTMRLMNGLLKPSEGTVRSTEYPPPNCVRARSHTKLASSSRIPIGRSAATPCAKSYSSDSKRKGA